MHFHSRQIAPFYPTIVSRQRLAGGLSASHGSSPGSSRGMLEDDCTQPPATIFMVDTDPATRSHVRELVENMGLRFRSYSNGHELLASFDSRPVGCVMLEVQLPELDGLDVQHELRSRGCDIPVLFLTAFGTVRSAVEAVANGAIGFLEKPADDEELRFAISNGVALHREQREGLREQRNLRSCLSRLSAGEQAVLELLVEGNTSREIAQALDLSVRTIEHRRASLMDKLNVHSLPALFRLVFTVSELEEQRVQPDLAGSR
ncbi:MAG TPA: response regulator [Planctomycetaceae bacterium]|nr:response regulator [Planctomycetaceae bacterium]